MRISVLLFLFLHVCLFVYAQNPIADGLNCNGLADSSVWATNSNPAQLASLSTISAGASVQNSYLIKDLNRYYVSTAFPIEHNVFSADMQYHGFSVWQEKQFGVAIARQLFPAVSMAAKLNYRHIGHGGEIDNENYFIPQCYLSIHTSDYLSLYSAFSADGFIYTDENYLSHDYLQIGAAYYFSTQLYGTCEIAYDSNSELQYSVGMEYALISQLALRFGISPGVEPLAAGLTLKTLNFSFDFGCRYHTYLGTALSVGIRIRY